MEHLSTRLTDLVLLYFNEHIDLYKIINLDTPPTTSPDDPTLMQWLGIKQLIHSETTDHHHCRLFQVNGTCFSNDIIYTKRPSNTTSNNIVLVTADNSIMYMNRRTTFAYDKLINCYATRSIRDNVVFCIGCVYYMGVRDRGRLYTKLTTEFNRIDPILFTNPVRRITFLFFWRKFLLELLDMFATTHNTYHIPHRILPGGKYTYLDPSPYSSMLREVAEETGITSITPIGYVALIRLQDNISATVYDNMVFFGKVPYTELELINMRPISNEVYGYKFIKHEALSCIPRDGYIIQPILIHTCINKIIRESSDKLDINLFEYINNGY